MPRPTPERRFTAAPADCAVRLETRDGAPPRICGYGAVFYDPADDGTQYQLWDDLYERIMPGAFDRALREDDCRALFNHDPSCLLARTASKTLSLSVDKRGLAYDIDPADTGIGRDVQTLLRRGDVTGSSFSFIPTDVSWREQNGIVIREVNGVQLFDVGPVTYPAYEATTAGLRCRQPVTANEISELRSAATAAAKGLRKLSQRELDQIDARAAVVRLGLSYIPTVMAIGQALRSW